MRKCLAAVTISRRPVAIFGVTVERDYNQTAGSVEIRIFSNDAELLAWY